MEVYVNRNSYIDIEEVFICECSSLYHILYMTGFIDNDSEIYIHLPRGNWRGFGKRLLRSIEMLFDDRQRHEGDTDLDGLSLRYCDLDRFLNATSKITKNVDFDFGSESFILKQNGEEFIFRIHKEIDRSRKMFVELDVGINIDLDVPFYKKVWRIVKYLFNKSGSYSDFSEFVLSTEDIAKMRGMIVKFKKIAGISGTE